MIVEDYGHHPTEIEATLEAARSGWPDRRIVLVFQPHRYTRTRDLFDDFSDVLSRADMLVVTDVYAAGEDPIEGFDAPALCQSIRARGKVDPVLIHDVERLPEELQTMLEGGDLVLMMGAGSIGHIAQSIREKGLEGAPSP
jgi:UDP-N-acetylmuramate--alanine ligase